MNELNPEKLAEGIINAGILYNSKGFFDQKIRLLYDKKNKKYYTDSKDLTCNLCYEIISDLIIYRATFNPHNIEFCCSGCVHKKEWQYQSKDMMQITGIAIIKSSKITHNLIPVLIRNPDLICRDNTAITHIDNMEDSEIIDNTVYALRNNIDYDFDAKVKNRMLEFEQENECLSNGTLNNLIKRDIIENKQRKQDIFNDLIYAEIIDDGLLLENADRKQLEYDEDI